MITSMFLHGGWLHIIANMWFLWIFGDNVEDRLGTPWFLVFYFLGGFAATALHVLADPHSPAPGVGASGAIAAVLGAYLVLFPLARVITLVPIFFFPFLFEVPAVLWLGFWFLQQWLNGLAAFHFAPLGDGRLPGGGVAWWAHVGGFLFGVVAALPWRRVSRGRYYYVYDQEWPFA